MNKDDGQELINEIFGALLNNLTAAYTDICSLKDYMPEEFMIDLEKLRMKINAYGSYIDDGIYQEVENIKSLFEKSCQTNVKPAR